MIQSVHLASCLHASKLVGILKTMQEDQLGASERPASSHRLPSWTRYAATIAGGGRVSFSKNTISVSDGLVARSSDSDADRIGAS